MIKRNYHTHTKRCGHAIGEDEEYVVNAIEAGLTDLGFSDHCPYIDKEPGVRMRIEQRDEYFKSLQSLKEKYKDSINIYIGMEVEYFPSQWETLKENRMASDYCIVGQHELSYFGQSSYSLSKGDQIETYTDCLYEACKHGLCDYIAHPDLFMYGYPRTDEAVITAVKRIASISKEFNMPLELNCGSGVFYGKKQYEDGERYAYPTRVAFEEFAKENCPMIIGLDVHNPALFLTDEYLKRALSVVEGLDIHFLNDDSSFDLIEEAKKRKQLFY